MANEHSRRSTKSSEHESSGPQNQYDALRLNLPRITPSSAPTQASYCDFVSIAKPPLHKSTYRRQPHVFNASPHSFSMPQFSAQQITKNYARCLGEYELNNPIKPITRPNDITDPITINECSALIIDAR